MALRLAPEDEYMHDPADDPTFNESMYFNCYDPAANLGAFFRVGNRPNEARAEVTVCVYLPDGRVGFMFQRPDIDGNERFDAGGVSFEVETPFESLQAEYDGKLVMLADPLQMADPKLAFSENPLAPAKARISFRGVGPMFGGEDPDRVERPGEEFARGHYEQLTAAEGTLSVGEHSFSISGFGLRDHSWGARTWQAPWYYRWLTGNCGEHFGFMASRVARRGGEGTRGGFVVENGEMILCDQMTIETVWSSASHQQEIVASLGSSATGRSWLISGTVLNLIPLRNRRHSPSGELLVTRISEGLTQWRVVETGAASEERIGYGLSEYLDQLVDGHPVGIDE